MNVFTDKLGKKVRIPKNTPITWRISGYVLIVLDLKLLTVVPNWSNNYELPGGEIKQNEEIAKGLQRECLEETGYVLASSDKEPFYCREEHYFDLGKKTFHHSLMLVFKGKVKQTAPIKERRENEIQKVEWKDIFSFNNKDTSSLIYPAINKMQKVLKTKKR